MVGADRAPVQIDDLPESNDRVVLLPLRLIADGTWFDGTSGTESQSKSDHRSVLEFA